MILEVPDIKGMLYGHKVNRRTEEIKTLLEEQEMPKITGIQDRQRVTMGQIGNTERRPHLSVLLPQGNEI